MLIIIHINWIR